MRLLTALTLVTLAFIGSAPAQESLGAQQSRQAQQAADWQSVITRQIEAFRAADAAGALSCAGASFRQTFTDPTQFYEYIASSDYEPIITSRTHSFGEFRVGENDSVLQIVTITSDQRVYKALYEMTREQDGWKVQGVSQLIQESIAT